MRRALPILVAAWVFSTGDGRAQLLLSDPWLAATIRLVGQPVISANPDLINSTSNDVGPWGAPEYLYSFANDYGPLGSPEVLTSVTNDYGTGLKIELLEPVIDLEAP